MKTLNWGETPWDSLTREELLREVQRTYIALLHCRSVMKLSRGPNPEPNSFWDSERGTGNRAMAMANQVLNPISAEFSDEEIYRSFFRYAVDLLFDGLGEGWVVCPKCDIMLGAIEKAGQPCSENGCDGVMRKLQWSVLAKKSPS